MDQFKVAEYSDVHLGGLLSVLSEVRNTYPVYPPPASAGDTAESFVLWLQRDEGIARKVAISQEKVIGHGMLSIPHDYIVDCLRQNNSPFEAKSLAEIGKLFVSPSVSHGGTGTALIRELVRSAKETGHIPVSCILEDSPESIALHRKLGFECIASFDGISGINYIFAFIG